MTNLFCLSNEAILALKTTKVKLRIMEALDISDTRTIEKHIKNNFPNGPLLNCNVREIVKKALPEFNENNFIRRLTEKDVEKINKKRKEMQAHNKKYNNLRKKTV